MSKDMCTLKKFGDGTVYPSNDFTSFKRKWERNLLNGVVAVGRSQVCLNKILEGDG